jgi:hypothetical protein
MLSVKVDRNRLHRVQGIDRPFKVGGSGVAGSSGSEAVEPHQFDQDEYPVGLRWGGRMMMMMVVVVVVMMTMMMMMMMMMMVRT